jgi:hypothetical protein
VRTIIQIRRPSRNSPNGGSASLDQEKPPGNDAIRCSGLLWQFTVYLLQPISFVPAESDNRKTGKLALSRRSDSSPPRPADSGVPWSNAEDPHSSDKLKSTDHPSSLSTIAERVDQGFWERNRGDRVSLLRNLSYSASCTTWPADRFAAIATQVRAGSSGGKEGLRGHLRCPRARISLNPLHFL